MCFAFYQSNDPTFIKTVKFFVTLEGRIGILLEAKVRKYWMVSNSSLKSFILSGEEHFRASCAACALL